MTQLLLNPYKWIEENQEKIFQYYLKVKLNGKLITSPFRKDSKPTCGFYYGRKGRLYLHDFGTEEHFDALEVVRRMFSKDTQGAIYKLMDDYDAISSLNGETFIGQKLNDISWVESDQYHNYFERYYISRELLVEYGVKHVKAVFNNQILSSRSTLEDPVFLYSLPSERVRIYRPLVADRSKKWFGNALSNDIFGYNNLPAYGQTLIITSSLKDVMVLRVLGYNAIAFCGEGYGAGAEYSESRTVMTNLLQRLSKRFQNILFFMDNDEAGLRYNRKLSRIYNLPNINIPIGYPKDVSDYIEKYGMRRTRQMLNKIIGQKFNQRDAYQLLSHSNCPPDAVDSNTSRADVPY